MLPLSLLLLATCFFLKQQAAVITAIVAKATISNTSTPVRTPITTTANGSAYVLDGPTLVAAHGEEVVAFTLFVGAAVSGDDDDNGLDVAPEVVLVSDGENMTVASFLVGASREGDGDRLDLELEVVAVFTAVEEDEMILVVGESGNDNGDGLSEVTVVFVTVGEVVIVTVFVRIGHGDDDWLDVVLEELVMVSIDVEEAVFGAGARGDDLDSDWFDDAGSNGMLSGIDSSRNNSISIQAN